MVFDSFFCNLSTKDIVESIGKAESFVCYAGPGIQIEPAKAIAKAATLLGAESVTVRLDFDERVLRMGYGHLDAVQLLRGAGIQVEHSPGLRSAILIVDQIGYTFTPTPLYLEAEPNPTIRNALRLSREQANEALARLSPIAKKKIVDKTTDLVEKAVIAALPSEKGSAPIQEDQLQKVKANLDVAPPVNFDVARQVRVFEPYLQYVELSLTGAAIQRHRLAIPPRILKLGGNKDLEGRLRTTFDLFKKNDALSSKSLEDALNSIRNSITPSLGHEHGRVVLKSAKPLLATRLREFRELLAAHQEKVKSELQKHLDKSMEQIAEYYLPLAESNPPDVLVAKSVVSKPSRETVKKWIDEEIKRVFPEAGTLTTQMVLDERYKDVTFETLNHPDFINRVKKAFPDNDWDKAYTEFKAAGESKTKNGSSGAPVS